MNAAADRCWPAIRLALLLTLLAAPGARAQEPVEGGVPVNAQGDEEGAVEAQVNGGRVGVFELNDQQFYIWVFNNNTDLKTARAKLEAQIAAQLDDLARTCGLSDAQRLKLQLAAAGDIKHFFDRVAEKRRKFSKKTYDQNKISDIFSELQPLQQTYNNGVFTTDSMFRKSIGQTLDSSQNDRYESLQRDRLAYRFNTKVDLLAAELGRSLGLSSAQRQKLVTLIKERIKPFRKSGQYDHYALMYKLSTIPEADLKAILDEPQLKVLERLEQNAKNLGQFLRQQGYFEDEPPDPNVQPGGKKKQADDDEEDDDPPQAKSPPEPEDDR